MDVAARDAPGVVNPFNWITDIGGAIDPNSLNSMQLPSSSSPIYSIQTAVFFFTLNNAYYTNVTAAGNAPQAMTFNRMGLLGGPLKNADGTANAGGVVTLTLWQSLTQGYGEFYTQIAQVSVDMTNAVPGQFYWSDPLTSPVNVWGSQTQIGVGPPSTVPVTQFYYYIQATCPVPYSVYSNRPVTLLNGVQWGSGLYQYGGMINDHLCLGGSVDIGLNTLIDLGTASFSANVALAAELHRKAGLSFAPISPQIVLAGQPRRVGVFEGITNMEPTVVLSATPMVGGPLWKPSRLCTG